MKHSFTRFRHPLLRATLFAWVTAFACGSNAAQDETKTSASGVKCCCLAAFGDDIIADEVDWPKPPVAVPKYPDAAFAGRWSARVIVEVSVDVAGKPKSMHIEETQLSRATKSASGTARSEESARHAFEVAVIEAARQWRFRDCSRYGGPTHRSALIPVDFDAGDDAERPAATETKTANH